jgi:hypothetical protein
VPLAGGEVDTDHPSLGPDQLRGVAGIHPRAAAQVEHPLPLDELGQAEDVADPGERIHRLDRDLVEHARVVAETLGERPPHREVVCMPCGCSTTRRYICLTFASSTSASTAGMPSSSL